MRNNGEGMNVKTALHPTPYLKRLNFQTPTPVKDVNRFQITV